MNASVGMSGDVRMRFDDEPTCIDITKPVSLHARSTGSQKSVWIDGRPSLLGFSEKAIDLAPRAAVLDLGGGGQGRVPQGDDHHRDEPAGERAGESSRMKSFHACTQAASSLSLASWKTCPLKRGNDGNSTEAHDALVHVGRPLQRVVAAEAHVLVGDRLGRELLTGLAGDRRRGRWSRSGGPRRPRTRSRRRARCGAVSRHRAGTRSCQSRAGSMRWSSTEMNQLNDIVDLHRPTCSKTPTLQTLRFGGAPPHRRPAGPLMSDAPHSSRTVERPSTRPREPSPMTA